MTYAFRDWLDPETLSAIVDDRPDMNEWLRSRAVPDTYRDFRFRDLVRIVCGMPDRAMPPAPREEWRAVPGFEGFYEVSDLGRVRSFHFGAARPKKPRPNGDGYPVLVLYGGGKRKTIPLHRLVAEVFHAAKRNLLHNEVAHLDGDRANARADNLKWVSKVENHFHMKVHGTATVGERHPRAKLTAAMVRQIRSAPEPFNCAAAARAFGVNVMTVFRARKGQSWRSI